MRITPITLAMAVALATPTLDAANLVQFTAGQPAKAAEVNANFKALNDELTAVKNFSDLTAEQIQALKSAVGITGPVEPIKVDCTNDPAALMNVYNSKANHNTFLSIGIKGSCYANLNKQFNGLTLDIFGDGDDANARLIPTAAQEWSLSGGFNGGLFLRTLTLAAPETSTAVLFSRSAQGSLTYVTIEGGSRGIIVQANAQTYLQDVKIQNTRLSGISVYSGGHLRAFNNTDNSPLIDTARGIGLEIDQGFAAVFTAEIRAPKALELRNSGNLSAFYEQKLKLVGNAQILTNGQLSVPQLDLNGSLYMMQGNLMADKATMVGISRVYSGSNFAVQEGAISAKSPNSSNYEEYTAFEVTQGSNVTLGKFSNQKLVDVNGMINANNAKISAQWTNFISDVNLVSTTFFMHRSNLTSLNRDANNMFPINISTNSTLHFDQSNVNAVGVLAGQSVIHNSGEYGNKDAVKAVGNFGATAFTLNHNSSYLGSNCAGNGTFHLENSTLRLQDCLVPDTVVVSHTGSALRIDHSSVGLVHVDSGSTAGFYNTTLTGNGQTNWGDANFNIGANSTMYLDNSSLTKAKHFNNNGVLRLQNTVDLKASSIQCNNNRGFIEWWSQNVVGTIGNLSGCNPAP